MKNLLGSLGVKPAVSPGLEVHLAAFGKHPGWDDHIPGIGLDTKLLARLKQALYVNGIGAQIDSGGWEGLDAAKRLPGFDHSFLGRFGSQLLLGCFWSSSDRLGRAKYPMVICLQAGHLTPAGAYELGWPILERLKHQCQQLKTQEEVNDACARSRLEWQAALQAAPGRGNQLELPLPDRQKFMDSPKFGPDHSGFLRVFHELDLAGSNHSSSKAATTKTNRHPSRFSRVPAPAIDSAFHPLVIWAEFLRCAVPDETPLLLLQRQGTDWVETAIGELRGDEFFCLQASPMALPLATEVPYDLPAALMVKFELAQGKFLQPEAAPAAAPATPPAPAPARPPKSGKLYLILGGLLLLVVAVVAWLATRHASVPTQTSVAPAEPGGPNPVVSTAAPGSTVQSAASPPPRAATAAAPQPAAMEPPALITAPTAAVPGASQAFQDDLGAAKSALQQGKFDVALNQVAAALLLRPGEAGALELQAETKAAQQSFDAAIKAGQQAYQAGDSAAMLRQAEAALQLKPGDRGATLLKDWAMRDSQFAAALSAGKAAVNTGDYTAALRQAAVALGLKPGDDSASQLQTAAVNGQKYQSAMSAGQTAFAAGQFDEAIRQADAALAARAGDVSAGQLQSEAQTARQAALAAAVRQQNYNAALQSAQAALAAGDSELALNQARSALRITPGDPAAAQLLAAAQKGLDLTAVRTAYAQNDFETVHQLSAKYPGDSAFAVYAQKAASGGRGVLESQIEVLMVQFGLESPKNAKSENGRAATELGGQLSVPDRMSYVNQVKKIRKQLKAAGWLTPELNKNLDDLSSAITSS